MNINELIKNFKIISDIKFTHNLEKWIIDWKNNDKNILELSDMVERFFGNYWIDNEIIFNKYYNIWKDFKENVIDIINGMTMNERLYYFGLIDIFDNSNNEQKDIIYSKLLAKK